MMKQSCSNFKPTSEHRLVRVLTDSIRVQLMLSAQYQTHQICYINDWTAIFGVEV